MGPLFSHKTPLMVVSTNEILFIFKLNTVRKVYYLESYTTHHTKLLVVRKNRLKFYHKIKKLGAQELDLFTYITDLWVCFRLS